MKYEEGKQSDKAAIGHLMLTFCPTMRSVQQRKLKLLMPVLIPMIFHFCYRPNIPTKVGELIRSCWAPILEVELPCVCFICFPMADADTRILNCNSAACGDRLSLEVSGEAIPGNSPEDFLYWIISSHKGKIAWSLLEWRTISSERSNRWFSRYIIAAMLVDENKRFLISSFCFSTGNCTLQHCYLCP